jgi:DNA invertase Pin-like site-specific DNA recombinase
MGGVVAALNGGAPSIDRRACRCGGGAIHDAGSCVKCGKPIVHRITLDDVLLVGSFRAMSNGRGPTLVGYARGAADEPPWPSLSLVAQEWAITDAAAGLVGVELVEVIRDDDQSGKTLDRPGLERALRVVADGEADGLIVSKLDRLSCAVSDFGKLLSWFEDSGAALLVLDLGVDASRPGRMVAQVLATAAAWEAERISALTRQGLAAARAQGRPTGGPSVSDRPELVDRIRAMRAAGMTRQAICDRLNAEGVPTARGAGEWRPSSLQAATGYRRPRSGSGGGGALPALTARGPRRRQFSR